MPKQQNGLICYIHHTLIPELQRQGRTVPNGLASLIPIAAPLYTKLPPHEKARYEEMAKNTKARSGSSGGNPARRDNVGNIIAHRQDPRQLLLQKRKDDRAFLKLNLPPGDAVLDSKFYVIGFQYLVEVENGTHNDFMPVEVGLVEWSMREGVTNTLQKFINPGDIPLGYRFKCQEHADETHKIPLDQIKSFDRRYPELLTLIENFVKPQDGDLSVYCMENEYERVLGCLVWLSRKSHNRPMRFQLRFLEDLSCELYIRQGRNISETSILEMLTTAVFDYDPNTSCEFHEENECKHCALGTARRYMYAMSDALSVVYNFDLTEKHLPVRTGSTSSYVLTDSVQEQMVPRISSHYSKTTAPAGRGYTVDPDGFGGRDFRYSEVGVRPATHVQSVVTPSKSSPDMGLSLNNAHFANTSVRAPSANQLPTPAFATHDVARSMYGLSLKEEAARMKPNPSMLTHAADETVAPSASAVSYAYEADIDLPRSYSAVSKTWSAPSFDAFAAPVIGRGRGISSSNALPRPVSYGRGSTRMTSPDSMSSDERPAPRIPPGFQGSGRGAALFY